MRSEPPGTDLAGLRAHWRADLIAGVSVSLVALPLALGIATAAGAPPISGLVSAIVAGLLCTFLRGSHVAINGPGNGLIVIVGTALVAFGGPGSFPHVLGAVVVAGALQVLFGLLRLGKMADLVPPAVVQGLLSSIGLIIIGKQAHVIFGHAPRGGGPIDALLTLPDSVLALNPFVAIIGVLSVAMLVLHPKIPWKFVRFVPAPLWVVFLAVPTTVFFNFLQPHTMQVLGRSYHVGPELLVAIPADLLGSLVTPDFSRWNTADFWLVVLTFTLVNTIENLVSVKAVDKLDAHRRRSSLDRDLVAVGLSSIVSAALGGLPVLTVIARSSVNVNHGGQTGWSNFFAGALLLVFVLFLSPVIQEIPLAALAGILVYTGYKLTAPHVVKDTLHKGPDHFLVFFVTVAATLVYGLLWGIAIGLAAELVMQLVTLGQPPLEGLRRIWQTRVERRHEEGEPHLLQIRGVANYLNIPRLRRAFAEVPSDESIIVDFGGCELVDNTVLEYTHDVCRRHQDGDLGRFAVVGLERLRAVSDHPDALHALDRGLQTLRLTGRQKLIAELAASHGWSFDARRRWEAGLLERFAFFRVHPVEYAQTRVEGRFDAAGRSFRWTLEDVTFDEGAVIPEVYQTTALTMTVPERLPDLILEREELIDRALALAGVPDLDFAGQPEFSRAYVVQGPDEAQIRGFLTEPILTFLAGQDVYHIEMRGRRVLLFKRLRLASVPEIEEMLRFAERLAEHLVGTQAAPVRRSYRAVPDLGSASPTDVLG